MLGRVLDCYTKQVLSLFNNARAVLWDVGTVLDLRNLSLLYLPLTLPKSYHRVAAFLLSYRRTLVVDVKVTLRFQ